MSVTATNKDLGDQDYKDQGPKDPQQVANPDVRHRDGLPRKTLLKR